MRNILFIAALALPGKAWAIDGACTQTPNLTIYRCPENSIDWYSSYTGIVDQLDALAKTAPSTFTILGKSLQVGTTNLYVTNAATIGIGTQFPATKLHLSSGTLLIDGNTTNSIITSGRVGVGNTNPTVPLSIQSVGGDNIYLLGRNNFPADETSITFRNFANSQTNGTLSGTGGQFQISGGVSSGTNVTSGNFGINAPIPQEKLHISSGTIIIDGNGNAPVAASALCINANRRIAVCTSGVGAGGTCTCP